MTTDELDRRLAATRAMPSLAAYDALVVDALAALATLEPLDAAWREAEAALPKGWLFHTTGPWDGPEYSATARCLHVDNCHNVMVKASTPAAALRALVAALRKPVTA